MPVVAFAKIIEVKKAFKASTLIQYSFLESNMSNAAGSGACRKKALVWMDGLNLDRQTTIFRDLGLLHLLLHFLSLTASHSDRCCVHAISICEY